MRTVSISDAPALVIRQRRRTRVLILNPMDALAGLLTAWFVIGALVLAEVSGLAIALSSAFVLVACPLVFARLAIIDRDGVTVSFAFLGLSLRRLWHTDRAETFEEADDDEDWSGDAEGKATRLLGRAVTYRGASHPLGTAQHTIPTFRPGALAGVLNDELRRQLR